MSVPRDAALPRLRLLLDPEAMAPILRRSLGRSAYVDSVRVARVSYKPGERVTVHYDVLVDGRPENAVAHDVRGHDLETLTWLPFDPRLPALAEAGDESRLLSYKPRRRAVLRVGDRVLKAYASEEQFEAATRALRTGSDLAWASTPSLEAVVPALRMTVQAAVDGEPVSSQEAATNAGAFLRMLQQAEILSLEPAPPERRPAAAARRKAALLATVLPSLERRLQALIARLDEAEPSAPHLVPAHGDFHAGQLLRVDGGDLWVLDLDSLCLAPPALDVAEYAAAAMVEALLEGHGDPHPDGLDWHLPAALLIRASHPFHRQLPDWPDRVESVVELAESVL
jgi:Phosphotransferase enzyme family